jgi:hypothetical protein
MKFPQKARLESLLLVQWFLDKNSADLATVNKSRARAALNELVPVLEAHATDQHIAEIEAQSRTVIKSELREDLRLHHMQQVAAIGRARLAGVADSDLLLKLQYPPQSIDDGALITAGRGMAQAAQQYKQVFLNEQLPTDFIEQLQAATEAVRVATTERKGSLTRLRGATRGVTVQLQRASHILHVLNSLVVRDLKGKPELLAAWKMAKRNRKKPGSTRTPASGPVSQPVQQPVPQPVQQPVATIQPQEVHADS